MLDDRKLARMTAEQRESVKVKLRRITHDGKILQNAQRSLDTIERFEAKLARPSEKKSRSP